LVVFFPFWRTCVWQNCHVGMLVEYILSLWEALHRWVLSFLSHAWICHLLGTYLISSCTMMCVMLWKDSSCCQTEPGWVLDNHF
jgi:hypothetical protein